MPRTLHVLSGTILLAVLLGPAVPAVRAAEAPAPEPGVLGRVIAEEVSRGRDAASPLNRASVFAYELVRASITKVMTGTDGGFRFDGLPAGVYKLIAFKPAYEPGRVLLS